MHPQMSNWINILQNVLNNILSLPVTLENAILYPNVQLSFLLDFKIFTVRAIVSFL